MKTIIILACTAFLISCSTVPKEINCDLADPNDGWELIEKPAGIDLKTERTRGRYVLWFKHESGIVMACERPKRRSGCGEAGTIFSGENGFWLQHEIIEVIVCT